MSSVEEDAFFASRRASSCLLKGMFFIVEGHVLERRWVCTPPPTSPRKGGGCLLRQRLQWFYRCKQRANKSGSEGQQEWFGGVIQMVQKRNADCSET